MPNAAFNTAKFAVKRFSEALIEDLCANAPGVRVAVVMPGHVGTNIVANSLRAHGLPGPARVPGRGVSPSPMPTSCTCAIRRRPMIRAVTGSGRATPAW